MWGEVSIFFDGLKLEGREEKTQCEERMVVAISSHVTNLSPLQRVQAAGQSQPSLSVFILHCASLQLPQTHALAACLSRLHASVFVVKE